MATSTLCWLQLVALLGLLGWHFWPGSLGGSGYRIVFFDDFSGPSLNLTAWHRQVLAGADSGNNELEFYTNSSANSFTTNSTLVIRAIAEQIETYNGTYNYTSAKLISQQGFLYGFFAMRALIPRFNYSWPAFWLLPFSNVSANLVSTFYGDWAACGEIDILETINVDPNWYGTLHLGGVAPDDAQYPEFPYNQLPAIDWTQYHIFAAEWTPQYISWYIDADVDDNGNISGGTKVQTVAADVWYSVASNGTLFPTPAPFNEPFNIIINMAIGGAWPQQNNATQPPSNGVFPADMVVDWVKVYQNY